MGALEDLRKYIVDELEDIQQNVETAREDLKSRLQLAKSGLADDWKNLEEKFHNYCADMNKIREAAADESEELLDAARVTGKELLTRYSKVKVAR